MRRTRNVAKLLARLNPKGMPLQFSGGGGGGMVLPMETAIDIAGALGAAGWGAHADAKRMAVLVLCLRWWPGVFDGPEKVIGYRDELRTYEAVRITQEREALATPDPYRPETLRRRAVRQVVKRMTKERVAIRAPGETAAFRAIAGLLAARIERSIIRDRARAGGQGRMHGAPLDDKLAARVLTHDFLGAWTRLVIYEYRHPNHCQTCTPWGRAGEVPNLVAEGKETRFEWITCPTCLGAGALPWSSKRRATALRIGEHPFRHYLKPHHDGALALLRELEWRGARLLVRRLGGFSDER